MSREKKELSPHEKELISVFAKPNLVLVVEGHEIHVEKTELCEKSPVFKTMLTSNFKEKDADRIVLPKQKLVDFLTFLRCTLSGFVKVIDVYSARTIIPIAHEYQTEGTLNYAQTVLADNCTTDKHYSESIIQEIIFAEKYDLKLYLSKLVECASKKMFCFFSKANGYNEISEKTLLSIALKRWEDNINPVDGRSMLVNPDSGKIERVEIAPAPKDRHYSQLQSEKKKSEYLITKGQNNYGRLSVERRVT